MPYHDDSSYGEEKGIGCLPKMVVELMKPASKKFSTQLCSSVAYIQRCLALWFSSAGRYGSAVPSAKVQRCQALRFSSAGRYASAVPGAMLQRTYQGGTYILERCPAILM